MAPQLLKLIFHSAAIFVLFWGYDALRRTSSSSMVMRQTGGYSQYLTVQSVAAALVAMTISIFSDFIPSASSLHLARRVFLRLALLLTAVVSTIYWPLVLLAPQLILTKIPRVSEPSSAHFFYVPLSIDLALHASPVILLLFHLFAFEKPYSKSESTVGAFTSAALFGSWYASWVEHCAAENKRFPYPFLNHPFSARVIIYIALFTLSAFLFRGISALHHKFHRTVFETTSARQKSAKTA